MKFRLIIDKDLEEEIVATVKKRTALIDEIESLVQCAENVDELTGYTEDDIVILKTAEIESIYVEDGKTYAACSDGNIYRLRQRLYEVEAKLPADFIRINKSAFANRKKIRRFIREFSGAVDIEFMHGHKDYVSRRCFADLKRRFEL